MRIVLDLNPSCQTRCNNERPDTKVAPDLKNADYRGASAIKAALFLAEFCGRTPFAHIDIAGTALLSRANSYFNSPGASGFGLRLLIEFLRRLA